MKTTLTKEEEKTISTVIQTLILKAFHDNPIDALKAVILCAAAGIDVLADRETVLDALETVSNTIKAVPEINEEIITDEDYNPCETHETNSTRH